MALLTQDSREGVRKRRAHIKSRKGCGNCKLRRVKCDEARPGCKKCLAYGVSCTYDQKKATLDLSAEGAFQIDLSLTNNSPPRKPSKPAVQRPNVTPSVQRIVPMSVNQTILTVLNNNTLDEYSPAQWHMPASWIYTEKDLETFQRFRNRTMMTIGTNKTSCVYQEHIGPMAFQFPFLMQIILSLTHLHDAHLSPTPTFATNNTHLSLQHWNIATHLYQTILSRPIEPSSRDALWATAALIGSTVYAYVEARSTHEAWPLKPSEPSDLNWLMLTQGKKAIWKIARPDREGSVFSSRGEGNEGAFMGVAWRDNAGKNLAAVDARVESLFEIPTDITGMRTSSLGVSSSDCSGGDETNISTTPEEEAENPYLVQVVILLHIESLRRKGEKCTLANVLHFLPFIAYMTPEFKGLLEKKDTRALVLLRCWYRTVEDSELWWLTRRAAVEGTAIDVWLENEIRARNGWCGMLGVGRGEYEYGLGVSRGDNFYAGWSCTENAGVGEGDALSHHKNIGI